MKFKKDSLVMIPVGGSEQIGMNANLYQFNDKWILVDLGIAFPDETQIGVDILLPDFDFIKNISTNLLGIFITHAHEDHYGAIQYFADNIKCPLWGTEFTLAMLRKKLNEGFIKHNLVLNPYPKNSNIKIGGFEVTPFQNSHSVPQSVSLLVKTKNDVVFIEGDAITSILGVKTFGETFITFRDNKILSGRYMCGNPKKKECLESKLIYNNLKNQFIPNNEILVVANPKKKRRTHKFF